MGFFFQRPLTFSNIPMFYHDFDDPPLQTSICILISDIEMDFPQLTQSHLIFSSF